MKNMKNRIILIFTLVTGLFLLNSCLKDTADYQPDLVAGKMYITVVKPTLQALALKPIPDTIDFSYMINIATDQPPTTDVTVTCAIDTAAVTVYNKKIVSTKKSFKPFPFARIVNPTIVIKAGTRTAMVYGKVWGADALNACDNFIVAVSFKSVSDPNIMIPANMKTYLMAVPISNPWAATYKTVGYRIRPGNPTEPVAKDEAFNTVDCKTVKKNGFGNYAAFDIVIEVTSETMVVGGVTCNKVIATPVDDLGAPTGDMFTTWKGDAATAPAPPVNPTEINYYNPATKQFVLNCYYTSSAGNRIMYEVHTRK